MDSYQVCVYTRAFFCIHSTITSLCLSLHSLFALASFSLLRRIRLSMPPGGWAMARKRRTPLCRMCVGTVNDMRIAYGRGHTVPMIKKLKDRGDMCI